MTPLARFIAVAAGLVILLLAGAGLVRQAALAADAGVSWPISAWWCRPHGEPQHRNLRGGGRGRRARRPPHRVRLSPGLAAHPAAGHRVRGPGRDGAPFGPRSPQGIAPPLRVHASRLPGERGGRLPRRRRVERPRRGRPTRVRPARRPPGCTAGRTRTTCARWPASRSCGWTSSSTPCARWRGSPDDEKKAWESPGLREKAAPWVLGSVALLLRIELCDTVRMYPQGAATVGNAAVDGGGG